MSEFNKPLALNLRLDYFRGAGRVQKWKGRLGIFGVAVCVLGLALSWGMTEEPHFGASPGPVSSPHRAWDRACSACHESFTAISHHSWTPPGMKHASGATCKSCHAGPAHHAHQTPELNCAACHREHRGVDHSLLKIADADCTQCHKSLANHSRIDTTYEESVSRFVIGKHPDFRSVARDPGTVKFNHALHMTPGIALRGKGGLAGKPFTLQQIPAADEQRKRYRAMQEQKDDDAPVELNCRSCHQLDARDM